MDYYYKFRVETNEKYIPVPKTITVRALSYDQAITIANERLECDVRLYLLENENPQECLDSSI